MHNILISKRKATLSSFAMLEGLPWYEARSDHKLVVLILMAGCSNFCHDESKPVELEGSCEGERYEY